jgi:hypothetical protein
MLSRSMSHDDGEKQEEARTLTIECAEPLLTHPEAARGPLMALSGNALLWRFLSGFFVRRAGFDYRSGGAAADWCVKETRGCSALYFINVIAFAIRRGFCSISRFVRVPTAGGSLGACRHVDGPIRLAGRIFLLLGRYVRSDLSLTPPPFRALLLLFPRSEFCRSCAFALSLAKSFIEVAVWPATTITTSLMASSGRRPAPPRSP